MDQNTTEIVLIAFRDNNSYYITGLSEGLHELFYVKHL